MAWVSYTSSIYILEVKWGKPSVLTFQNYSLLFIPTTNLFT